jgi:hypothetical protein
MSPGRNDPCPCNSGKKYKHCCLAAASAALVAPEILVWRRLRGRLERFPQEMLKFMLRTYGEAALDEAWDEFTLWNEDYGAFDPESPYNAVFIPWMQHCWAPDPEDTAISDASLHDITPTQAYLTRMARRLDPLLRSYLEGCLDAPLGFHEVLHCDPGRSMQLRDVFTGATHLVLEGAASQALAVGDLLYAQVVEVEGICVLEGCSSVIIPPQRKIELIQLRSEVQQSFASTGLAIGEQDRQDMVRACYLRLADEALNPLPPLLQNTDGDLLIPQKLQFDIDSPTHAFDLLKHLDCTVSESELREQADYDPSGKLRRVEFTWSRRGNSVHAEWDNTILGQFEIDRKSLTLCVNSERRAAEGRKLIEQALGDAARHRHTIAEPFDPAVATGLAHGRTAPMAFAQSGPIPEHEAQAALAAYMTAHVESWPEQALPALAGRTPLQAMADADGREMVAALIRQFERSPPYQIDPTLIPRLRARLGLTDFSLDD